MIFSALYRCVLSLDMIEKKNCQVPEKLVLPHLACSTIASLVRKEKQKEHMFSSGAFHCIQFLFLYPVSRWSR
jgi:hypothetical protein